MALPQITIRQDGLQARKKASRVASENGATFQIIQRRALQHLFGFCSKVSALIGKVCSVQNFIDARNVTQHAEHGITCRESRRRSSSSNTGSKAASPRYTPL